MIPIGAAAPSLLFPRAPYLRRLVRRHFPEDRSFSVLDLGCGHGAVLYFANEAGYRDVNGVDRSGEQVAAARALGIEGVTERDLMETIAVLPDGSRDVVVAFDLIEHFRREEVLPLVEQVRRVLKPGGRLIIHTPNAESPFFGRIRYGDLTHDLAFTRSSLSQLLLASGFRKMSFHEDEPVIHGLKSATRFVSGSPSARPSICSSPPRRATRRGRSSARTSSSSPSSITGYPRL
ncbi:MAG: class I SAM-dependent methyltransferase [Planctomycetaceae bacterium]|nr:class I SAM-dependent methyltransferase [Planctomycetaceae bacterium]MBV8608416.1 class I SAM-dependent methyltransferase [Singulisphaera sp.]